VKLRDRRWPFVEITRAYPMLPVRDMDRAISFYRDVVGLAVEFQSRTPERSRAKGLAR
jgi:predicted enzyme related to lactoylglutathione lyase